MRLTRTAIGLLTRQYRSVLRKCWMINVGLWQAMGDAVSKAVSVPARLVASLLSGGALNGEAFNALDEILLSRLFERKLASLTAIGLTIAATTMPTEALAEDITSRVVNTGTATYTNDTFTGIISSSLDGGAVYNEKTGTISFNNTGFEGNVGENGGALYNRGRVDSLSGGFSYNHATSRGGAIYQKSAGTMGDITADFTQNYVSSTGIGKGGAIYNGYKLGNITGNFTRNYVNGITDAEGGAIKQSGRYAQAGNIVGNFISNYVIGGTAGGGAMSMDGSVGNISGDFVGNTATSNGNGLSDSARGGAVTNNANITSITGNFTNNLAQATGTYVPETSWYVPEGKKWEDRVEVLIPATVTTVSAIGGALVNGGPVSIGEISGSFSGNAAKSTAGNAFGGGIYNDGGTFTNGIVNSSFTDNYAQTASSSADVLAHGGAIWTNSDLILKATNGYNMLFSGNYVEKAGVKTPEAIWLELYGDEADKRKCGENGTNCLTLTLNTSNGGTMRFDDQINGDSGYKIQITNDGTGGQVVFNNSIKAEKRYEYGTTAAHADIQLGNKSSLKLGADNVLSGNNLSLAASNTATLDLRNGAASNTSLKSLTLGNSSNLLLAVDADLRNAVADRLTADSYTWNTGSVMINAISLATLSDADSVDIQLVDPAQTGKYSVDSSIVNDPTLTTYYSTIAYNPGTGVLSLANKTTYAPINLVGSWSNGNYITRYNASDSGATSVGANLKLLDDAIGTWNNEVAGSNLVLYDANNASATGVGANMMRLDRAVVSVKNDLNTVGNNLNATNNNLANNYYTKENTHAILGQVTSSEVISFSGEFSTTHTVGNAISELDTQIGSFEKIDSASASIEHNTQRAEYITEKATLLENYENEEDFTTKARIKNNYDIHEDTDAYAALTPSEKVEVDNDYTTYSSLVDDEAKAPYNFAAENLTELNNINGELNGDYAKDWAVVYHLDDNATVTANLINLDSVIGTWDNGTDGKRTINGHQLTSHLKPYDDTSDETKAETSVGANLVLLDEAILGVEDTLAGFDWLATAATGSAASASMDGTAIGYDSEATQVGSLALGFNAKATGTNGTTAIGSGAQATGAYSTAVGKQAQATVDKATALGNGAVVQSEGSVALGYGSKTGSDTYVVSVGSGIASHSATDQYRRIINVADAVNAHDAVTLGQLQNNYYRKLMKKDEIFDTNEGIVDVKSLKKDTNSSEKKIIKGVSAFPSIMCTYPFDMPHTANDDEICNNNNTATYKKAI